MGWWSKYTKFIKRRFRVRKCNNTGYNARKALLEQADGSRGSLTKCQADEGYNIEFIDGDENRDLAIKYNIRSIPTTVIEEEGKEINRIVGVKSKEEIIEELSWYY